MSHTTTATPGLPEISPVRCSMTVRTARPTPPLTLIRYGASQPQQLVRELLQADLLRRRLFPERWHDPARLRRLRPLQQHRRVHQIRGTILLCPPERPLPVPREDRARLSGLQRQQAPPLQRTVRARAGLFCPLPKRRRRFEYSLIISVTIPWFTEECRSLCGTQSKGDILFHKREYPPLNPPRERFSHCKRAARRAAMLADCTAFARRCRVWSC